MRALHRYPALFLALAVCLSTAAADTGRALVDAALPGDTRTMTELLNNGANPDAGGDEQAYQHRHHSHQAGSRHRDCGQQGIDCLSAREKPSL